MRRAHRISRWLAVLFLAAPCLYAADLHGRVIDASGRGVQGLTAAATATRSAGGWEASTSTDPQGYFRLPDLPDGSYLFTVLYGETLLHREVVEVRGSTAKDVTLR